MTDVTETPCIPRSQAARAIGISISTLDKMVMRQEIPATQTETRRWLFTPAAVERARRFIKERK